MPVMHGASAVVKSNAAHLHTSDGVDSAAWASPSCLAQRGTQSLDPEIIREIIGTPRKFMHPLLDIYGCTNDKDKQLDTHTQPHPNGAKP